MVLFGRTIVDGHHEDASLNEGLLVGRAAMASNSAKAATIWWERWRPGLRRAVFRIQSHLGVPLTGGALSGLLVVVENRVRAVIGSVTSALCQIPCCSFT